MDSRDVGAMGLSALAVVVLAACSDNEAPLR